MKDKKQLIDTKEKDFYDKVIKSEARLKTIMRGLMTGIVIIDEQTHIIVDVNPAAADMIGLPREKIVGEICHKFICPAEEGKCPISNLNQKVDNSERILLTGKGEEIPILKSVTRIDLFGRSHLLESFVDISERKEMEAKLVHAKQEAIDTSQSKTEFIANMSHEIRTPMNGIMGMTELLLDTELSEEQKNYAEMIRVSSEFLLTIINDILDFSKIEARKLDLDNIDFNLNDTFSDTVSSLAKQANQKGLELIADIPPELNYTVSGDPGRLRQVLINLINNAIKFTVKGKIVVSVREQERSGSKITMHFTVADTGIGIPKNKLSMIFQYFAQVDSSLTRKFGGTGLGLTISSMLAHLMGGRIWVESEEGKGSRFHFTVVFNHMVKETKRTVRAKFDRLRNMSVLIVDDNPINRLVLYGMLKNWKMIPKAVESGKAALNEISRDKKAGKKFDLILIDFQMPEMDGFSLVERIIKKDYLDNSTIMMLTSSGNRGDAARCRKLGIRGYLLKPIKQSELFNAILLIFGTKTEKKDNEQLITRHSVRELKKGLKVLLAEDNIINQKVSSRILEKYGHLVTIAVDGEDVLAKMKEQTFDLILMDVKMPNMDGFEATDEIRSQEKKSGGHIPIIAMTAHVISGYRDKCISAGMDDCVTKPMRGEILEKIITLVTAGPILEKP